MSKNIEVENCEIEVFKPYKITIKTKEMHSFLRGLIGCDPVKRKQDTTGFHEGLDQEFYEQVFRGHN